MQPNMKSICCVVFFADCVKMLVQKMQFIYQQTFAQANYNRKGFIYKKEDLLIPDQVTQPEEYKKALGERPAKKITN